MGASAVGYAPILGYVQTPAYTEEWLQYAVATVGPVTIAIDVVKSFSSGIYYDADCSYSSVNYVGGHAMVVVGYGTNATLGTLGDYWIVRNSWNTRWGQAGHVLMARNRGNLCGLAYGATYPVV